MPDERDYLNLNLARKREITMQIVPVEELRQDEGNCIVTMY